MKLKFKLKNLDTICILFIIGLLLLIIPTSKLIDVIFIIIGAVIILTNVMDTITAFKDYEKNKKDALLGLLNIILGIILIINHGIVILILIALYFIALPLYKLYYATNKKDQFISDLPKYIIGVVLILLSPKVIVDIIIVVLGICFICVSVLILIGSFYMEKEIDKKNE